MNISPVTLLSPPLFYNRGNKRLERELLFEVLQYFLVLKVILHPKSMCSVSNMQTGGCEKFVVSFFTGERLWSAWIRVSYQQIPTGFLRGNFSNHSCNVTHFTTLHPHALFSRKTQFIRSLNSDPGPTHHLGSSEKKLLNFCPSTNKKYENNYKLNNTTWSISK